MWVSKVYNKYYCSLWHLRHNMVHPRHRSNPPLLTVVVVANQRDWPIGRPSSRSWRRTVGPCRLLLLHFLFHRFQWAFSSDRAASVVTFVTSIIHRDSAFNESAPYPIHFDAQSAGSVAETKAKPLKIETSGGIQQTAGGKSWGYGEGGADQRQLWHRGDGGGGGGAAWQQWDQERRAHGGGSGRKKGGGWRRWRRRRGGGGGGQKISFSDAVPAVKSISNTTSPTASKTSSDWGLPGQDGRAGHGGGGYGGQVGHWFCFPNFGLVALITVWSAD